VITWRYLRHGRRRTVDPRAPFRARHDAAALRRSRSVVTSPTVTSPERTRGGSRWACCRRPATPSDVGIGERAVWFRDSEGNLLGIGQAKRW